MANDAIQKAIEALEVCKISKHHQQYVKFGERVCWKECLLCQIDQAIEALRSYQPEHEWRPESEKPEAGEMVLLCVENSNGKRHVVRAQWIPRWFEESSCENEGYEYSEEKDNYYTNEGWYESNDFEETHWLAGDVPIFWQPLPHPPHAPREQK